MFNILAEILFLTTILFALCIPFFSLQRSKNYRFFCLYWTLLYISQLFMYLPGADVSPYAYAHFEIRSIKFMGLTLSAWACIILLIFIVVSIAFRKKIPVQSILHAFLLALIPNLLAFLWTPSLGSSIDSFAKAMAPFFVMLYFTSLVDVERASSIKKVLETINILMVAQVLLCKVAEGTTSAYNYYYELTEEFFGYYNHPHSYTSLLWILTVYNTYAISRNERKRLNIVLFMCNVVFIYFTGVRTYLVALFGALGYIGLQAFSDKRGKHLRGYVIVAFVFLIIAGPQMISNFGAGRDYITDDASSGRLLRWGMDLQYAFNRYSPLQILFGRGVDASFSVNREVFGVYINSLNLFIDLLLDYGIIGGMMVAVSYYFLFRPSLKSGNKLFSTGMLVSFIVASIINSPVSYVPTMTMLAVFLWVIQSDKTAPPYKAHVSFSLHKVKRGLG